MLAWSRERVKKFSSFEDDRLYDRVSQGLLHGGEIIDSLSPGG
jgi:hypothetical protein